MPYIGHNPTNAGSFIFLDDIASGFNNSETDFTLQVGGVSITPNTQNLLIALDGVIQQAPDAYTVSGSTISFTAAVPSGTDFYGILMGQSASIGLGTIGADELKISGNGTNGQLIKTDGDGTFSYINQNTVTASTAATLATARTINGVSFDGSGNITVTADANTLSNTTLKSTVVNSSLTSVGNLTGLTIAGTGTNAAPNLAIDNSSSSSYIHSIEALGANMTQGQINIINLGKIGSTKNSGVIGYKWDSAGSDNNLLTFEHWGTGPLITMNGVGNTTFSGTITNTPNTSGAYAMFVNQQNSAGWGLRIAAGADSGDNLINAQNGSGTEKFVVKSDGSANFAGAVTANGADYVLKAVSTSTTDGEAIRISAESGVAQGKIELDWFNNSSETGGGYGMIQVGKSSNAPELRIGASAVRIGSQQGSQELKVNRSRMRHIDGLADANANFSHGDLYVNHISTGNIYMQRDTYFGGHITVDTGGTSIITADGNNTSGDDGRLILKGHTAGQSRAYVYFNNGVSSGGLNWYVGNLRGSNAFSITCGNDDAPGYGGGSHNDTVLSIDGNRKIGIGNNPGSQKLKVYNDSTNYTVLFQNNQGDGAVLDLYASASDDHDFDPIFRVRTDAQNLFMIDNKGNWYSGDNFVSNPWDLSSGEGGLYFRTGYNNSGQTFAIANNQDRGYAVMYSNAINADATDGRHIQWMNDGTPAGHVHFNSSNSVAYNTTQSDKTLKKNFADWTENILDSFDKINPQLFHFKIQDDSEEKVKGFIAQEMVDKFPEAYPMGAYGEGDNKKTKYHFNPSGMVVYLMKAVKELSDKIKVLEAK